MSLPAFDPWGDPDDSRARQRFRVGLWELVALGLFGLVCGGGVPLVIYFQPCGLGREAADIEAEKRAWQASAPSGAKWEYTRAEFEKLVVGKTGAEVEALIGRPSTRGGEPPDKVMIYRYRTTSPTNGRPDRQAVVHFGQDKAVWVEYH